MLLRTRPAWSVLVDLLRAWGIQVLPFERRTAELAGRTEHPARRALADRVFLVFLADLRHGRIGLTADRRMMAAAAAPGVQLAGVLVDYRQPSAREHLLR